MFIFQLLELKGLISQIKLKLNLLEIVGNFGSFKCLRLRFGRA
jgi:hypothetical protein